MRKETKTLRELIELAKQGKKFRARVDGGSFWSERDFQTVPNWASEAIVANWTYEEIKEPIKLEFEVTMPEINSRFHSVPIPNREELHGKKFKVTMTEVQDD